MISSRQRPDRKGYALLCFQQHLERIKNMKGTVDCGPPREHPLGNKSEMDKRRHFASIEFDNKLLLERLAKIVQKKTIDNEIHESTASHAAFKAKLGLTKKRLEMQRITEENQRLLKRIQEVPPAYNHLEWEEEYRRKETIKKSMSLYPEYYKKKEEDERRTQTESRLSPTKSTSRLH